MSRILRSPSVYTYETIKFVDKAEKRLRKANGPSNEVTTPTLPSLPGVIITTSPSILQEDGLLLLQEDGFVIYL